MNEEWISLNEYSKRYKMNHEQVKKLLAEKKIDYFITDGGQYKIKVGHEDNEREKQLVREVAELKTTIKNIYNMISQIKI